MVRVHRLTTSLGVVPSRPAVQGRSSTVKAPESATAAGSSRHSGAWAPYGDSNHKTHSTVVTLNWLQAYRPRVPQSSVTISSHP